MYLVGKVAVIGTEIQYFICTSCGLIVGSYVKKRNFLNVLHSIDKKEMLFWTV